MRVVNLPPEGYVKGSRDTWGRWHELWIVSDPPVAFEVWPGWVVQIGSGAVGKEVSIFEEPNHGVQHKRETAGETRLAFRARKVDPDTGRWKPVR